MEPALDVINRALAGDPGARSFLERTTSIYVLDVTDKSQPKTYGCWNFIHQAMNEVERYEARVLHQINSQAQGQPTIPEVTAHTRLLATMALKVARRSPSTDKVLVATCISNASEYTGTASQSEWLVDLNLELREIVIGRIAAMALDFSFHNRSESHGKSAFADKVVMDTFCAILSANAVASGPAAIRHFASEWIIPSSGNLPSFAVAAVVLHLAGEAMRTAAPAGTKDTLQQLSMPAFNVVLIPILSDAVSENSLDLTSSAFRHQESSQVAAMCLRAMKTWCDATDLSLPQIKHICTKVDVDVVGIICDTMYSDSSYVIDALAEFIETTVVVDEKVMSTGRMNQVRHILGVDEFEFKSQFSGQQLKAIESREMAIIADEVVSGVGLQRFRFVEREIIGDFDLCRNLARIAASVCNTWLEVLEPESESKPERGLIILLMKAAAHPAVHVCAISLPSLNRLVSVIPALAEELLPILQRRAIIPHRLRDCRLSLDASDLCGVNFHEFQNFRENVLVDALVACWKTYADQFMDSCTSAVEEFCSGTSLPVDVSLQLEAALFCLEKVATEVTNYSHIKRVFLALTTRTRMVCVNPFTRLRMSKLVRAYIAEMVEDSMYDVAFTLLSYSLRESALWNETMQENHELRDSSFSPATEAADGINRMIRSCPTFFTREDKLVALSDLWDNTYVAISKGHEAVTLDCRLLLCSGICLVLYELPADKISNAMRSFSSKSIELIERLIGDALQKANSIEQSFVFAAISDEIRVLSRMAHDFSKANASNSPKNGQSFKFSSVDFVGSGWPSIKFIASNFSNDRRIASAFSTFLSELLPPFYDNDDSLPLLRELCSLASLMNSNANPDSLLRFVSDFVRQFGASVEKSQAMVLAGVPMPTGDIENQQMLGELIVRSFVSVEETFGNSCMKTREQKNGQDAFERRQSPVRQNLIASNESLGALFSVMTQCLEICPLFVIQLPVPKGVYRDNDLLVRRTTDAAVESLFGCDPETTANAICFLSLLVECVNSQHDIVRRLAIDAVNRIRDDCLSRLVVGSCGKYEWNALDSVSNFIILLSRTFNHDDLRTHFASSLQQEHFLLGDTAKLVTLEALLRIAEASNTEAKIDCFSLLCDIWRLHQVEDVDALPESDEVARFIQTYRRCF